MTNARSWPAPSTYRAWRAMFIAECKSERLWKYLDGSAIIPELDSQDHPADATTTEGSSAIPMIDNAKVEGWWDKKETYEGGFEQAKKKCFMSVDKAHLATILELSTPNEMFNALDKKYSATNAARLRQLLRNCQANSTQKKVLVMEKYESIHNLNEEIRDQKPELVFQDEHLINFLLAKMPSTSGGIIDNLNMRDTRTLDRAVCALRTKRTELTDLGAITEESAYFAARGGFHGG